MLFSYISGSFWSGRIEAGGIGLAPERIRVMSAVFAAVAALAAVISAVAALRALRQADERGKDARKPLLVFDRLRLNPSNADRKSPEIEFNNLRNEGGGPALHLVLALECREAGMVRELEVYRVKAYWPPPGRPAPIDPILRGPKDWVDPVLRSAKQGGVGVVASLFYSDVFDRRFVTRLSWTVGRESEDLAYEFDGVASGDHLSAEGLSPDFRQEKSEGRVWALRETAGSSETASSAPAAKGEFRGHA